MARAHDVGLDAAISGVIGLVIGVTVTLVVAAVVPTPWTLWQVLLAVGTATFFASAAAALGAARRHQIASAGRSQP